MSTPTDHKAIPAFPRITAQITDDETGKVSINGISRPVTGKGIDEVRTRIVAKISETATKIGRPVRATTTDPAGVWPLIIHPDGTVEQDSSAPPVKPRTESKTLSPTPSDPVPHTSAPPSPPARAFPEPPPLVQTVDRETAEAAPLRDRRQSARWWEEVINENNQARGSGHRVTLMNPPYLFHE